MAFQTGYPWSELEDADYYISPTRGNLALRSITPFEAMLIESTALLPYREYRSREQIDKMSRLNHPWKEHIELVRFNLDALSEIPKIDGPKFVFAHILVPHIPFVFAGDGTLRSDPGFWEGKNALPVDANYEKDGYAGQVEFIDNQVLSIFQEIIANSSTPPIIVIMGDHGFKQIDRNKILNAYYFPDGDYSGISETISPVNTFRIIFDRYFGTDFGLLVDRSFNLDEETFEDSPACNNPIAPSVIILPFIDSLPALGYPYPAPGRDRRGRNPRTPTGPRGSIGKEAPLGAAGKPVQAYFFSMTEHSPICSYEGSDYPTSFWEQGGRAYEDEVESIALGRLLPRGGARLLELGAGGGRNTLRYVDFKQIVLLDYSVSQLEHAQKRLGKKTCYRFVAADIYRLPFMPGSFDCATMIRTLHHMANPRQALEQVQGTLQKDARFILEFANKRNLKVNFEVLAAAAILGSLHAGTGGICRAELRFSSQGYPQVARGCQLPPGKDPHRQPFPHWIFKETPAAQGPGVDGFHPAAHR